VVKRPSLATLWLDSLPFSVVTWNINSVRLRIESVVRFLKEQQPDVLCLQETKCPDANFPRAAFEEIGYGHIALNGQKGYHGVAIVSRHPFADVDRRDFCEKATAAISPLCSTASTAGLWCIISTCRPAATSPTATPIRNSRTS